MSVHRLDAMMRPMLRDDIVRGFEALIDLYRQEAISANYSDLIPDCLDELIQCISYDLGLDINLELGNGVTLSPHGREG
jgi:hypothetical protein